MKDGKKVNGRHVRPVTVFSLMKKRPIHFIYSLVAIILPLFVTSIFILVLSLINSDIPNVDEKYLINNGTYVEGKVTKIESQQNVTINGQNPMLVSYQYSAGDSIANGIFRTLDPKALEQLDTGVAVTVSYDGGGSVLVDFEPFHFPVRIIVLVVCPIFFIGLISSGLLYLRIKKELHLYRFGEVGSAEVTSVTSNSILPFPFFKHLWHVHYRYESADGSSLEGVSITDDQSFKNKVQQGDQVQIFLSKSDYSKSCLIPKLEAVRNGWDL
ncbi:hypothetical protein [Marinoscillum furvescens]|uniref:DUF3592 domain-containing protein n=1 Tax=Marinoscillum furvescens DSM 4134 TaxID=1122208 RepID=A0A3D9KW71_MARFU|nr:hypothetical protein [Marinoscillum furvescens]RED92213.1 hypothetical protein C7460_13225 [Marinoscillum furvescens DSM 4134]